eukprot:12956033-Alexandrium_andersonii.AAC.1
MAKRTLRCERSGFAARDLRHLQAAWRAAVAQARLAQLASPHWQAWQEGPPCSRLASALAGQWELKRLKQIAMDGRLKAWKLK